MAEIKYEPMILAAEFDPNPAGIGYSARLRVVCIDAAMPAAAAPEVWHSGERSAGEV